ncbi:MAG TPA: 2,3,4,5-tetrahydropyridine-2,6-dicarboxylate N-succinyltransferase, partial [Acidobacteriota bacterium]|nr:2,3,4,5-tetrahydropyridine-2,6-dicarboxylate N-succinyltransferase [Acidobacteriota bacterium]
SWVKQGILLGFRSGVLQVSAAGPFSFVDKDTFPPRRFDSGQGVRVVPGGTAIRRGAHIQEGVVIMPPAYLNVGCFVGSGTMVDSHALVGSCAQIGKRVHLSAGTQIGGVLEPVGAAPVVVEDDVFVGGNCGIYEGTVVGGGAVLGAGTILTRSVPVYDTVRNRVLRGSDDRPLAIPEGAVVVPGSRPAAGQWAQERGLSLSCAVIIKYRDAKTNAGTALEEALR